LPKILTKNGLVASGFLDAYGGKFSCAKRSLFVATKIKLMSNYCIFFICKDSMHNLKRKGQLQERQILCHCFSLFYWDFLVYKDSYAKLFKEIKSILFLSKFERFKGNKQGKSINQLIENLPCKGRTSRNS
jgi:hypothetical protein